MNPGLALALALPLGGIELRSEKAERQDQMLRKGVEWMGRNASISWCEGKTRQVGRLIHRTSFLRYKIQAVLHLFSHQFLGNNRNGGSTYQRCLDVSQYETILGRWDHCPAAAYLNLYVYDIIIASLH